MVARVYWAMSRRSFSEGGSKGHDLYASTFAAPSSYVSLAQVHFSTTGGIPPPPPG
jgi:hypothetical protein